LTGAQKVGFERISRLFGRKRCASLGAEKPKLFEEQSDNVARIWPNGAQHPKRHAEAGSPDFLHNQSLHCASCMRAEKN